jgi:hypothetical protein
MTDWATAHEHAVEGFAKGWASPGPHAWDDLVVEDAEFVQPMLRDGRGRELWWDEAGRLLDLLPDLHAEVLDWSGHEDTLYIHVQFHATLGGEPFSWRAVDLIRITPEGTLLRRESFFDSAPLARTVLTRPRAWWPWWRSGIAPLEARRMLQRTPRRLATSRAGDRRRQEGRP